MNIPPPYPDEHAIGWRGRIRFFNHHPQVKNTIAELKLLFDRHRSANAQTKTTPQLFVLAHFSQMTPRDFAHRHSFLPFIRPFGPDIFAPANEHKRMERFLRYSTQTGKTGFWFCTSCVNEDMESHRMPYWRRTHQLIGVDWCLKHRHKLTGISKNDALDRAPPIDDSQQKFLVPDGPVTLDEAEPIVQRYAFIAESFMARLAPLDIHKTEILLKRQFFFLTHDHLNESNNIGRLEQKIPPSWLQTISRLRTKAQGNDILNFQKTFNHIQSPLDTERYIVALALFFETADAALSNLNHLDNIDLTNEKTWHGKRRDVWWHQHVLHDYAKSHGCHQSFSSQRGLNFNLTSVALAAHGLPDFGNICEKSKKALRDFFNGQSITNVCQRYDLNPNDIESLLRVAGARLGQAFKYM